MCPSWKVPFSLWHFKKRKLWLSRLQSNQSPLPLHTPPSWLFPPLNMNITHRSLSLSYSTSAPFSFTHFILSGDFYPDPCETEKTLLKTILLGPQTLLVQITYYVVFFTGPCIGSPKCSVFAFIEDYSLSVSISTRSYSSVRFSQWLYPWHDVIRTTDQWLFDFCLFVWDLAVPESMQPADIRPHPTWEGVQGVPQVPINFFV